MVNVCIKPLLVLAAMMVGFVIMPAAPGLQCHAALIELNAAFNVSLDSLNVTIAAPDDGYFWPILSSRGFNSTSPYISLGFSFGFYYRKNPTSSATNILYDTYLAVCCGLTGNSSDLRNPSVYIRGTSTEGGTRFLGLQVLNEGFAIPVWFAPDVNKPLTSVWSASLVWVSGAGETNGSAPPGGMLQLRDQSGSVVWNVSNAGAIEIEDEPGNLVIYDSISTRNVVFRSSRDTLLQGQQLTVGEELTSMDSSYKVLMEKGGLVLQLDRTFMGQRPSPYWVIPYQLSPNNDSNMLDLNTEVSMPPCPSDSAYSTLGNLSATVYIKPGSCSNASTLIGADGDQDAERITWSSVKLEDNGRLVVYAVDHGGATPSVATIPVDKGSMFLSQYESDMPYYHWGDCDIPMACGPLGVCTPTTVLSKSPICECPYSSDPALGVKYFNGFRNAQTGCTRLRALPPCTDVGNEHINTTHFLPLNQTASLLHFSGWAFNSTYASMEACQISCSTSCTCNGIFYQTSTSDCYLMTEEFSLLNVTYTNLTSLRSIGNVDVQRKSGVVADDYVFFVKVTNEPDTSTVGASSSGGSKRTGIILAIVSSVAACLLVGLTVFFFVTRVRRQREMRRQADLAAKEEEELQDVLPLLPSRFSYQELHEATGNFSKLLGAGGCGSVYAGLLPDGRKVAVKFLEAVLKSGQSKQFLAEVATIGRTSHHNIVRLVGFCWEVSHRLLVYEYVERGSLDYWLFVNEDDVTPPLLNWQTRYSVALGIARGLSYLHEDCPQPILHFDIKPQNILLDGAFVAKLADFGMARLLQRDVSEVVTGVRGTPGYIAPEWLSHGAVSKKSDVYSMGMVLLEIVGGRKNVDLAMLNSATQNEEWHFPSWAARKCEEGMMMELVDRRHQSNYDEEQARRLIYTAFWCIQQDPGDRPTAPCVVQWLEGGVPVREPPFATAAHTQSRVKPASLSQRFSSYEFSSSSGNKTNSSSSGSKTDSKLFS